MSQTISITAIASISPLGNDPKTIWENYQRPNHCFTNHFVDHKNTLVGKLDTDSNEIIEALKLSDSKYKSLDSSVLYAMAASRKAIQNAGWTPNDIFGINIGSSRGATDLFEKHHQEYLETGKAQTLASPTTTLGNISSWVAHDLQSAGPEISHSITCSTALHALLNGVAWLRAGMADKFIVGGSEAPLTDFTIAQMRALKIYSNTPAVAESETLRQAQRDKSQGQPELAAPEQAHFDKSQGQFESAAARQVHFDKSQCQSEPVEDLLIKKNYPCRALDLEKTQNTLILGEGAAICCLETGKKENALAFIEGIGYATEILEHNISISAEATCFQKSMKMALENTDLSEVNVIVMHAPGTKAGDLTEYKAIQKLFGTNLPLLTTNKWKIGHTFGASGMLSIEMAILMLQHQKFIGVPFISSAISVQNPNKVIKKVLVNAVGFGGNAVSVLLSV